MNSNLRPAGYAALTQRLALEVIPNWHESSVAVSGTRRIEMADDIVRETYPPAYWPGEQLGNHLEFALKYDGTNLAILSSLFAVLDRQELAAYVASRPTGKYARRLWFLYELLTSNRLDVDDLKQGNYVDLLDSEEYYTVGPARPVRRQRINNNLPGDARFCPTIRRTETLRRYESADLPGRCRAIVAAYSPEILKRALAYLYTKETKSSFEIEHVKADVGRTERFMSLLRLAEREDFFDKSRLIDLQNRIVDPRFRDTDYRRSQNYIGQTVDWRHEKVHYVSPTPGDLPALMEGLIAAHQRMGQDPFSPVVHAAVVAYAFVFLHPFEDGNGRIHRFLLHNILARRGFTPQGIMFPISATMLKSPADYDASLEAFSRRLMPLVEYMLDEEGRMTVRNQTAVWYRYLDMTNQVEALFKFIEQTIEVELVEELDFLRSYDQGKRAIQSLVDMPDRHVDLFIRFCLQNNGKLSAAKRASHFARLTDDEVNQMETAVRSAYGNLNG